MSEDRIVWFRDGTRVHHQINGTGTVTRENQKDKSDLLVYVIWDNEHFPSGTVSISELEPILPGAGS